MGNRSPHQVQPKIDAEKAVLENMKLLPPDVKMDIKSVTTLLERYLAIIEEVANSVPTNSDSAGYLYRAFGN